VVPTSVDARARGHPVGSRVRVASAVRRYTCVSVGYANAIVDEVVPFVVALGEIGAELDWSLATVLFAEVVESIEVRRVRRPTLEDLAEERGRRSVAVRRCRGVEVDTASDSS
jgi:hypothetical protein